MAGAKRCPSCDRFIPDGEWCCPYCDEVLDSCRLKRIPLPFALGMVVFLLSLLPYFFSDESFASFVNSLIDKVAALAKTPRGAFVLSLAGIIAFCPIGRQKHGAPMPSVKGVIAIRLLSRLVLFVSLTLFTASIAYLASGEWGIL